MGFTFDFKIISWNPKSSGLVPIQRGEWKSDRWSFLFAQFMHRRIDFNLLPALPMDSQKFIHFLGEIRIFS